METILKEIQTKLDQSSDDEKLELLKQLKKFISVNANQTTLGLKLIKKD